MVDIAMIAPVGPAVSEVAQLPLPVVLPRAAALLSANDNSATGCSSREGRAGRFDVEGVQGDGG